jgi:hypothetical protein
VNATTAAKITQDIASIVKKITKTSEVKTVTDGQYLQLMNFYSTPEIEQRRLNRICERYGLLYVRLLPRSKFKECMKWLKTGEWMNEVNSSKTEIDFIRESNRIEGIFREPTKEEIEEFKRFMALEKVTIEDMKTFVSVYQPNARLRDVIGYDVRVGNYIAPRGGADIYYALQRILEEVPNTNAFNTHIQYEKLHPFTDGNGRSGRMLWAWKMKRLDLGFLHMFYYQTLQSFQ